MKEKLLKLLEDSYAKYSNYRVACICVMEDNKEFCGVNVENASFGATICAERVAIANAVSHGYRKGDFRELHVMVDRDKIGTPCFICRQVMSEFFNDNAKVYVYSNTDSQVFMVNELCPHPFGEDNL